MQERVRVVTYRQFKGKPEEIICEDWHDLWPGEEDKDVPCPACNALSNDKTGVERVEAITQLTNMVSGFIGLAEHEDTHEQGSAAYHVCAHIVTELLKDVFNVDYKALMAASSAVAEEPGNG